MAELDVRFELNPAAIFQNCPEDPGIYTVESKEGDVLWISYARNLTQSVTRHLPENELKNDVVAKRGRFFRFFITDDPSMLAQIFDSYVKRRNAFPQGMKEAPEGSIWFGKAGPASAEPAPIVTQTEPPVAAVSGSRARNVVLVDDDVQLLVLMKELLEMEGYKVYAAANRKMLGEALKVSPIDVLVLDFHLADLTARQVIDATKERAPGVLIFLITGTTHKEEAYSLIQAGVRKIFPKPFSMKMLSRSIEQHFEQEG